MGQRDEPEVPISGRSCRPAIDPEPPTNSFEGWTALQGGCGQSTPEGEWSVSTIKSTSSRRWHQGGNYDNALVDAINGLYKAEAILRLGAVEDQAGGGTGNAGMGGLVQPSPADGAAGTRPAC